MALRPDTRIQPILTRLTGCVETELKAAGFPDMCFLGLVSGIMADGTHVTGESGPMAWVRQGEITPVVTEGQPNVMSCATEMEVDVEVGYLTCYPVEADGSPLTVEQNLQIFTEVNAAMMALHRAINCGCAWVKDPGGRRHVYDVISWAPAGPIGGAIGGAWSMKVVV